MLVSTWQRRQDTLLPLLTTAPLEEEGGAARTEERALGNLTSCTSGSSSMCGGLVAAARTLLPLTSDQLHEFYLLTSARCPWLTSDQLN